MPVSFQIACLNSGSIRNSIALGACRAGALGVLDFEFVRDYDSIWRAIQLLNGAVRTPFGIKIDGDSPDCARIVARIVARVVEDVPDNLKTVILTSVRPSELQENVRLLQGKRITTLLEVTGIEQAQSGAAIGVDGLVAKGNEAGGRVADETTFVLLQRLQGKVGLPVWAHGGIGLHTVAACAAAGAAGVILDSQLALTRDYPLNDWIKSKIATMDGSETICLGESLGETYRVYFRPANPAVRELQEIETRLTSDERPRQEVLLDWREAIQQRVGWESERNALLLGQDTAFAASLAKRFLTVGGILQAMREAVESHCEAAERLRPLTPGSPLAQSHKTRYPILQGPMTRVSDVPEFAARVAEEGALPFLALALMRGPEIRTLLTQAKRRMGGAPWGVGILGFVPAELRQEQLDVVREYLPPFALISGGRPDQAHSLDRQGIVTYLHVPSPGLLKMFVQQGARRFVFEGRECGGHVGPRTSFVLWNQMMDVLLEAPELQASPADFHVVFAAGIHDALSAAMVSVIAAPLADRGVRVGVLLGTAYLFTEEAVGSGAILKTFQDQAQLCSRTVLLETGPGHSTRCVDTPFAEAFLREKRRLSTMGMAAEEVRMSLESLNLGRLRIASKGLTRSSKPGHDSTASKLVEVDRNEQVSEGMYMIGQLAALRNSICTIEAVHHDVSVEGSNRLEGLAARCRPAPSPVRAESASNVAIVGMACLLPKAPDLQTYWENILNRVDAVTDVPPERWDPKLYFDSDPKAKDKIYSRWGGFLEDVPFDPVQYGMPPASLRSIEPAQLLTLRVVRAALEDAGYWERPFNRERTSVILGAGGGAADLGLGYGARSFLPALEQLPEFQGRSAEILDRLGDRLPEWTEDSFAGILTNVLAGRVANRFDFGGSNFTVDAACASSLAAVSLALKELEGHTSDMVVVGGVDTMQNPFTYLCFSKTHALSPRGRSRTFDESADGIAISEGIAIMVFKRLEDAERDGDRIYAVIRSAGSSSDGKDRGLTAPRPEGQARALKRAYGKAGISPATVGLIEAHGTGTVAGDGAEVQALTQVFSEAEAPRQGCAIGSVKSMIGHTKCTAGAAGLVKTALALHHRILPATLGVDKPNPRAKFPETPFFVNTETRPWLENSGGVPRRAGVSAFGFGGTNFHVVMEEYTGGTDSRTAPRLRWSHELFLYGGESRESLLDSLKTWDESLSVDVKPELRDLAYTAWKQVAENGAATGTYLRLAIVASSLDDLRQKLKSARESLEQAATVWINDPRGIYFSAQPLAREGKLAFLFPGQGSQYPRMLQDLLIHFPEMRATVELADRVLVEQLNARLSDSIFPPPVFSREEQLSQQRELTETNIAQPALGAVEMAMYRLLRELGLQPDMLAGHSYGEYVALAAAGTFTTETLVALSEARGRFIVEGAAAEPGTMAAVEADANTVRGVLEGVDDVCMANANAPRQTVISGTRVAVEQAVKRFSARGIAARAISVACAFHSPLVAQAQAPLAEFLSGVTLSEPDIPVYSNTAAAPYPKGVEAIGRRLAEHLVLPVEFVSEIEKMYDDGARVFVEVGPRGVLTGLVDQILGDRVKVALASDQNGRPGLPQLLHLLGQLAAQGCAVNADRLYRDRSSRRLDLASLSREYGEKPLPASTWMVNGSRAVPVTAPVKKLPMQNSQPKVDKGRPAPTQHANGFPAAPYTNGAPAPPVKPAPDAAGILKISASTPVQSMNNSLEAVPQVMTQFQQMMTRFLDTQKTVMLAYLGGEHGQNIAADPLSVPVTQTNTALDYASVTPPPAPVVEGFRAPAPQPAKHAPAPGPAIDPKTKDLPETGVLKDRLLAIVSERTGYPTEMLGLNMDLEADLGIDSIKRVEILGTFQQAFAAAGAGEDGLIEKLAGVRTLQGIIDRVAEHARRGSGEAPVVAAPAERVATAARPSVSTVPDGPRLTAQLLAIVSERTGYPPEMLDLNVDLEADLGIDSIKRVEILGTFQQAFVGSGLPEDGLMEKLAGVRTLQGIVDRVLGQMAPKLEPAIIAPAAVPSRNGVAHHPVIERIQPGDERIQRFKLTAVETRLTGRRVSISRDRTVLISNGGHRAARALERELLGCGYMVAVVHEGRGVQELNPGSYAADLGSMESAADLIALVSRRQGVPAAIIALPPQPSEAGFTTIEYEAWKERLRVGVKSLFHLAKAAGPLLREAAVNGGASLLAVTGMGGAFLSDLPAGTSSMLPADMLPDQGAIAGLVKTLALEWPEVRVKVVDLNPEEHDETLVRHLVDEFHAGDGLVEVGYSHGRRVAIEPVRAPLHVDVPPALDLDSHSVVVITGGARGITGLAARHLAGVYRPTLILAGRSPLPQPEESPETAGITGSKELKAAVMDRMRALGETVTPALVERAYARLNAEREIRATLNALRETGARAHYVPVDVRDRAAFGAFIDHIYTSFGRIDGVIHGAGVIEDKLIQDKTAESFDRVFETKVDGAFVLSRKLRSESLKFLIFFSSVSARFGNRGQGDYAAANEVLNKMAVCLDRSWPARVVALNWGPWDTDGMVSPEVRKQFAERGVELIAAGAGLRRLEEELKYGRSGESEIVIGGAGWQPSKQASPRDWPLLGNREALRSDNGVEFIREFDTAHDLYLNDHRLDGRPVLPLAIATELMAEAAAQAWPELQVSAIRDLRLLNGVVLESGTRQVRIKAKPQAVASSGALNVDIEVTGARQPHRVHYRATVELSERLPYAPPVNLTHLTDGQPFSMDIADLYRRWLFHGPTFQGIDRVDVVAPGGIQASLSTSTPEGWIAGASSSPWLIDPLMFDSALQLLVLWGREHWDMTALPSGFQSFRRFAGPVPSRILCELRLRPNTCAPAIHSDIFFIDADRGNVIGIVEDMQGTCSKTLNRLAEREFTVAAGLPS
jgi:acyl transferase domain-containing protein/NAD(P)H-dependent flavin oxidoreductase YrpB (nitropropane dioxygenase family)/NAD(P)-dependent dehydrogenase (short-subunit alcohol dehydrogenase family)/acyl carrier protein